MSIEKIVARMATLRDEMLTLAEMPADELSEEQAETLRAGVADLEELETQRVEAQEKVDQIARLKSFDLSPSKVETVDRATGVTVDADSTSNPWDAAAVTRAAAEGNVAELHSRALSAAETTPGADDGAREGLTQRLGELDGNGQLSRLVLATTSPAYKRAFAKLAKQEQHTMTTEEAAAVQTVRGMSVGTGADGGDLVIPTDLEPGIRLSSDGNADPISAGATKVTTMSNNYRTVTSTNASWSWDSELAEVSDDTTTFTELDIPLYSANAFIPVSDELVAQSASSVTEVVGKVLNAGHEDLVAAAVATGTGSGQPTGLIVSLTASADNVVTSATADTFAAADLYATFEALPPRVRQAGRATWAANIAIIDEIRQFATADGSDLIARIGDGTPLKLLGSTIAEASNMDGTYGAGENYVLVYGDMSQYYIATAIGSTVKFIPTVAGANGRPIGAVGFYVKHRFGADVVNPAAFSMLNVT